MTADEKTEIERRISVLQIVDRICEEFESQREAGLQVDIADYLNRAAPELRDDLFAGLLRSELIACCEQRHIPRVSAYVSRFPDRTAAIRSAFAEVQSLYPALTADDHVEPSAGGSSTAFSQRFIRHYQLGAGGQGEVWLAEDRQLDRFVAIKLIKESERDSRESLKRFWREAHVTSKLEHPNIVPVYEAGRIEEHDGRSTPYYAMRVYGNRYLLQAFSAFYSRTRESADLQLLEALTAFHNDRSAANDQRLTDAVARFRFDEARACDRDLRDAIDSLYHDRGGSAGRNLRETIDAWNAQGRPAHEFRELLTRFIDVCNALAYAHSRGVIHRDLKPENVMLGEFGETLVVDWGLAKVVGTGPSAGRDPGVATVRVSREELEHDTATRVGDFNGTVQYVSPEQASGLVDELSPATDIYSLGAILYVILTGHPLRAGDSWREICDAAKDGRVVAPSIARADVPRALEAVCLKAVSKSPAQRYASAKDLASDVSSWLADESVTAFREPFTARVKRWVRRHPAWTAATCAGLLAVGILSAVSNVQQQQLVNELQSEVRERQRQTAMSSWDLAHRLCEGGDVAHGMLVLAQVLESLPSDSEFSDLQRALRLELAGWQPHAHSLTQVWEHPASVTCLAVTSDGSLAATGCADGNIRLWDVNSGVLLTVLEEHQGVVNAIAFTPEGSELVSAGANGKLILWDILTKEQIGAFVGHEGDVYTAAVSADGEWVLSGGADSTARLWSMTGRSCHAVLPHAGVVRTVGFNPVGRQFFTGGENAQTKQGELFLHELDTVLEDVPRQLLDEAQQGFMYQVRSAVFSSDGQYLVVGDDDWECSLWDVREGQRLAATDYGQGRPGGVAISCDGRLALIAANESHSALLWNLETVKAQEANHERWGTYHLVAHRRQQIASTLVHPAPVTGVAFVGEDDSRFLTASEDGCVRVWRSAPGIDVTAVAHHPRFPEQDSPEKEFVVRAVAMHPRGGVFATGGWDGLIRLWSVSDGTEVGVPIDHGSPVMSLVFTPDGQSIISGGKSAADSEVCPIRIWNLESRDCVAVLEHHSDEVSGLSVSSDGGLILAGGSGMAVLWNAQTLQRTEVTLLHYNSNIRVATAISPRGDRLVTAADDGQGKLWDIQGRLIGLLEHDNGVWHCAFSRDGRQVITGGHDDLTRIWDSESGLLVSSLQNDCSIISAESLHNGGMVITGSESGAQLWDIGFQRRIGNFCRFKNQVVDIDLSPDERTAVLADWNGYGVIWRLPQPVTGTPQEITDWVEATVGLRLDDAGSVVPLAAAEWVLRTDAAAE